MDNYMGRCEYCGKEMGIMAESQEEANHIVAKECFCGGAKQAEEIERKKQELRTQLDQLTGPDCEELNFIPLPEELRDILNQIGEAVVDGKIRQITMKTYGTQIVIRGGEKIKATRSYKYEQGGEVSKVLDSYYENCAFPKPKSKEKKLLHNGYKDKHERICWYTRKTEQNGMKFGAGQTGRKALRWDFKLIFARSCMRGFMQNCDE